MPGLGIGLGLGLGGGGALTEAAVARMLVAAGLSDAQARAAIGGAVSLPAGLRMVGLLPVAPPAFAVRPSIDGAPRIGQSLTGMDGTILGGTPVSRRWLLGAAVVSTALTYVPTAIATLVYEVTARGAGGTRVASSQAVTVAPAPASSATALPAAGAIVARWDASSLAGLADGAAVASWTDAAGGATVTQATAAKQPTFHAAGQGGKPYVLLAGGQYLNGAPGSPASTAYTNSSHTTLFFVRNVQATGFGRLMNGRQSNDGPFVTANGSVAGGKQATIPFADPGFAMVGKSYQLSALGRGIVDGTQTFYADYDATRPTASDYLSIGGADYFDVSAKAEVYECVVWNKELTQTELLQAVKYGCDKYGAAYPWAGQPFRMWDGDSVMCDYQGTQGTAGALPPRVAALKGWKPGTYSSSAIVGQSMAGMSNQAPVQYDGIVAQLGSTPAHLYAMEYANQRALPSDTTIGNTRAYIAARKAAGFAKVILGNATAIGATGDYDAAASARRAAYNASDWTGTGGADALIDVGHDPEIGVDGVNPGPDFADSLHPNDAGYTVLARLFAAGAV